MSIYALTAEERDLLLTQLSGDGWTCYISTEEHPRVSGIAFRHQWPRRILRIYPEGPCHVFLLRRPETDWDDWLDWIQGAVAEGAFREATKREFAAVALTREMIYPGLVVGHDVGY